VTAETLLRLALVPTAVWVASLAARRWGHAVSGYLGGMPLIGGPITLFLALDLGADFAARSALYTLAAIAAQATHLLFFGHVGRRTGSWAAALAAGWGGFAIAALLVTRLPLTPPIALAIAVGSLAAAWRWLPSFRGIPTLPAIPAIELRLRLVAAFLLAAFILASAPIFGPVVSGVLLSLPITGSIMPPFTLALYGPDSMARLLRGFVVGISGFAAFFVVVSSTLATWGIAIAFAAAVVAAACAVFAVSHILRGRRIP